MIARACFLQAAIAIALTTLPPGDAAAAAPGDAVAFRVPVPVRDTLDNGVRVDVFPDHRLPIVQMELLIPVGSAQDPPDAAGLVHLIADMLRQGTSSRSADEYERALDRLGGNVVGGVTRDYTTVDARFLAADFESGMELMSDAVLNATFPEDLLPRVKTRTYLTLTRSLRDPEALAAEQSWPALFGDRPYGRSPYGSPESLGPITADRLRSFYFRHFVPRGAILSIAGDVTAESALAAARNWFGRWAERPDVVGDTLSPPPPPAERLKIRLVDTPGLGRTWLRMVLPAPARGSDDESAFVLANAVFGSSGASRLATLRESGELRGARSFYLPLRRGGLFSCSAVAANDSVRATIEALRGELQRFVTQPPDERELAPARRVRRAVYPMAFETLGDVVSTACAGDFYGDAGDRRERIAGIGAADVARAIRRWIRPEGLTIVAVGPAAAIRSQLESLGPVTTVASGGGDNIVAEQPSTPEQMARGREVVRLALAAHGGLDRLKHVHDSTLEADATLDIRGQQLQGDLVQIRKEPFKMVYSTSFAGMDAQQVLNGHRAWTSTGGASRGVQDMDSTGVQGMRSGFSTDVPHLLLAAADSDSRVASRGRDKVGGVETDVVDVTTPEMRRRLYFDAKTHLLVAMDQFEARGAGRPFSARRLYRDYHNVSGIQWPFVEERLLEGQRVMLITVKRVQVDTGVDDSIFEHPQASLPPPMR